MEVFYVIVGGAAGMALGGGGLGGGPDILGGFGHVGPRAGF